MEKNSGYNHGRGVPRLVCTGEKRGQRLTLRKAQAMKLLLDRGYAVSLDTLKPTDE